MILQPGDWGKQILTVKTNILQNITKGLRLGQILWNSHGQDLEHGMSGVFGEQVQ
jgi:hypothetical protein